MATPSSPFSVLIRVVRTILARSAICSDERSRRRRAKGRFIPFAGYAEQVGVSGGGQCRGRATG